MKTLNTVERILRIAGWVFVATGVIGLIGHSIRPAEWPEVESLGKAGGFVLDAISIGLGVTFLLLGPRVVRRIRGGG